MRVVFAGSHTLSCLPLKAIEKAGFEIAAVITQPDKPVGRRAVLTPNPVKVCAQEAGLPVFTYEKIRDHVQELALLQADCMVTCAYGQILSEGVLDSFPKGVYNIHTSLLPRWRGASPIQHAILAGDAETGVTVMRTEAGLDTGDILLQERVGIGAEENAAQLSQKLFEKGAEMIVRALSLVEQGKASFQKQSEEGITLCKKIKKADCVLDFSRPAKELCDLVRAMCPEPLAFTRLNGKLINVYAAYASEEIMDGKVGEVVKIVTKEPKTDKDSRAGIFVKTGRGLLCITLLQPEGGKVMKAADFANGRKAAVGDMFGETV